MKTKQSDLDRAAITDATSDLDRAVGRLARALEALLAFHAEEQLEAERAAQDQSELVACHAAA